ncbi:glycosyltransferase family 2 protein [Methylobacterium sp. P31]
MTAPLHQLDQLGAGSVRTAPTFTSELPRVSLVIPTLNEELNVKLLLPRLPRWLHEVIIVDGRSQDRTVEVCRQLLPEAKIVLEPRKGKGAALRAGFHAATGDITVMMDADGSMDPNEIILLVGALLTGADFAKGSRFLQGGGTEDMSLFRMLGNWGLRKAVQLFFGGKFSDLCYGYVAFWTKHTALLSPKTDGFEVETFLNVQALKADLRIIEVPSFEANRVHGESNLRAIPDGWRVLKTILRERFETAPALTLTRQTSA